MSTRFNVLGLLSRIANTAPPPSVPRDDSSESGDRVNTTIRFAPEDREFLEATAAHYGVSVQAFITMMVRGLRFGGQPELAEQSNLMTSRFYEIFSQQNLSPIQTCKLLEKYDINPQILKNPELFASKITTDMLKDVSEIFNINPKWLEGTESRMLSPVRYDRHLESLAIDIIQYRYNDETVLKSPKIHLVMESEYQPLCDTHTDIEEDSYNGRAGLIVEFSDSVTSYIISEPQPWDYSRTRRELKAFLMFIKDYDNVWLDSRYEAWTVDPKSFASLMAGHVWPFDIIRYNRRGTAASAELSHIVDERYSAEAWENNIIKREYSRSRYSRILEALQNRVPPKFLREYVVGTDAVRSKLIEQSKDD